MLSDDQANDTVIEIDTTPSGVQRCLSSNQIVLEKTPVNWSFSRTSSTYDIDGTDAPIFSHGSDRKAKPGLRFLIPLSEPFPQTLRSPESVGVDTPCPSHENIQGSKVLGQRLS